MSPRSSSWVGRRERRKLRLADVVNKRKPWVIVFLIWIVKPSWMSSWKRLLKLSLSIKIKTYAKHLKSLINTLLFITFTKRGKLNLLNFKQWLLVLLPGDVTPFSNKNASHYEKVRIKKSKGYLFEAGQHNGVLKNKSVVSLVACQVLGTHWFPSTDRISGWRSSGCVRANVVSIKWS